MLCGFPPWHLRALAATRFRNEKETEKSKNAARESDKAYPRTTHLGEKDERERDQSNWNMD